MTIHFYSFWRKTVLLLFITIGSFGLAQAQEKSEKEKNIMQMVENGAFVFKAQSAQPARGRSIHLTSEYDIRLSGDTLQTYLPYYGRAYSAQPYSGDGGIKITSTDYKYSVTNKKRNRWNILIEPNDVTGVQHLVLSVSKNGYANLQVISTTREPISFNGYITALQ